MRRTIILPTAIILATLTLAGCSAASNSTGSGTQPDSGGVTAPAAGTPADSSAGTSESLVKSDGSAASSADRQVITTGYVTVTVKNPTDAAADAVRITEGAGGRIDGRSETAPVNGNKGSATLVLRIPADTLTATLDKLRALGEVQEVSLNATDVTMQVQDLDARITAMRASVDRLLTLLATAKDTDTLITLETAISDRQAQLESMESELRYTKDQVSMSSVTLNLVSDYTAPAAKPDDFFSGLTAGWKAFVAFFAGLLVALGVMLPWLVLAGIVTVAIIAIIRRGRRMPAATSEAPTEADRP